VRSGQTGQIIYPVSGPRLRFPESLSATTFRMGIAAGLL
jgi:hypothetical protein